MCRNIKTLHNFRPPATHEEVRASALQFVRKLSGFTRPSKANQVAFEHAVEQVTRAAHELLDALVTTGPPRDRALEAAKARARSAARFDAPASVPLDLDAWRAGGARFTHRGHPIFYRLAGVPSAAPALLCIHGFPTASYDWHLVWDALVRRFGCVVAPDMIGFGFSAKPRPYGYSMFDQADLHEALLTALGIRRVHLLAHDYGDTVAQELLARHAEGRLAVESACLLNGGLFPETHRATHAQELLAGPDGPALARLTTEETFAAGLSLVFGPRTKPAPDEMRAFWRLVSEGDGAAIAPALLGYMEERRRNRERWVGALVTTRVPVRLVNGPEDPVSGGHMVERYRELVPDPDVVLLPGIGHYPQVEDPDGVVRAFLEFHARLGTPG